MESILIEGVNRAETGAKNARALRKEGKVPCVMYGSSEPVHFSAEFLQVRGLIYTPNFYLADVKIDGNSHKAILKDTQFDPVSDQLLHADFLELSDDRKVILEIPIKFTGQAEGVREGGKLMPKMRTIRVKGFPKDLVSEVDVDVTPVALGKSIKVKDVVVENLEIMNPPGIPLASVEIPRSLRSAASQADAEAEGDAPAEGEEGAEGGDA